MKKLLPFLFTASLAVACSSSSSEESQTSAALPGPNAIEDKAYLNVYVRSNGGILVNNVLQPIDSLPPMLDALAKDSGVVHYSRANPQGEPPPESMKVMDLVASHSLSIRFYTDSTFTTVAPMR